MTRATIIRIGAVLVLVVAIAWVITNREHIDVATVSAWFDDRGPWAAPAFVVAYAMASPLFFPASVLTLTGGAVFGPLLGTALSVVGATIGATLAFFFARFTGGQWVRARLGGKLESLATGVEADGWRFIAFVRLVPLFPFNMLNYALGLTRISPAEYILATAVCIIPGTAAYSYIGHAGRTALTGGDAAIQAGLIGIALLATAAFLLPRAARWLRADPGVPLERTQRNPQQPRDG